jgi:serine/threonine protein kinase
MAAPATSSDFLDLVRGSELADGPRLEAVLREQPGVLTGPPSECAQLLIREGLLTCFQAEQVLQGRWRNFILGGYRVLERLYVTSMASVYLCDDRKLKRLVAIKVLPENRSRDSVAAGRFLRECRALAALSHLNITRIHAVSEDGNLYFLVTEYVDGTSLKTIVRKHGALNVARASHYVRQAAFALQHIHDRGLIHRNIKPGMLLLDHHGTIKIRDIAIGRACPSEQGEAVLPVPGSVLGTPDFMAPEQGGSVPLDTRADIYSLGCTFYFLLSGRPPFPEGTVAQKLSWHRSHTPTLIPTLRPEVPEGLVAIVDRMMAKDPALRYQTAGEVADALGPWTRESIPPPPEAEMPVLCPLVRDLVQRYAVS